MCGGDLNIVEGESVCECEFFSKGKKEKALQKLQQIDATISRIEGEINNVNSMLLIE